MQRATIAPDCWPSSAVPWRNLWLAPVVDNLPDSFWEGLPAAWVVADIVRMEDDVLAEHWDVIQDEATREQSRSGLPMFGDKFPA